MSNIADEILWRIDIVDVVSKYVPLKRAGANFTACCPFHSEKTPSFVVSPQKQIYKCFGCGMWWNAITFVKEIEKIDFRDVIKILAKDANVDLAQYEDNFQKMQEIGEGKEKIKRLHKLTQNFFVENLQDSQKAKDYLYQDRKLSEKAITEFGVGFAPDSYYDLLTFLKSKWFKDQDLLQAGLAKQNQNGELFSFFRNRITFPIYDKMSNVVAFSARILDPKDNPKYLNSPEHPAFDKSEILYGLNIMKKHIKEFDCVIIVEGQMDVIALYRLWFPVGLATSGTALTPQHIKLIKRYTDNVYFLFDNDKAWNQATIRALKVAYQQDIFPKIISLPTDYKDVDDLANEEEWKEKFTNQLGETQDAFLVIYDRLRAQIDITSPIEKQRLISVMFDILVGLESPSTQDHYLNLFAEKIGLWYEILLSQYKKYVKTDGKFFMKNKQNKQEEKYQTPRDYLYYALFYNNFIAEYIKTEALRNSFMVLSSLIAEYTKDNLIHTIFFNPDSVTSEDKSKLNEMQLRWENELWNLNDEHKQYVTIKNVVMWLIQNYIKILIKDTSIEPQKKQEILTLRQKL